MCRRPDSMHPVVRQIISAAGKYDAVNTFDAQYRLAEYKQRVRVTGLTIRIEKRVGDRLRGSWTSADFRISSG
jgi:Tfp pilus assembly protein PilF